MSSLTRIVKLKTIFQQTLSFTKRNLTSNNVRITQQLPLLNSSLVNNSWIYQENDKINLPILNKIQLELPNGLRWVPPFEEPGNTQTELELPSVQDSDTPLEAARLIVIRRRKMKRHKLKKLRKRMKYEWAKRRQRREWKKEKAFQEVLIQQCKQGESFSAEDYVESRLKKLKEVSIEVKPEKCADFVKRMRALHKASNES